MNANQKTQCDFCAFKITEDQSSLDSEHRIEEKYKVLRSLIDAPKKPRKMFIGGVDDKTETCFINSPNWVRKKENVHCPDRKDDTLSLESALSFRLTELANKRASEANDLAREANSHARRADRRALLANIAPIIAVIIAAIAARTEIKWLISWLISIFKTP